MKVLKILDHLMQDFQGTDDGLLAQRRDDETMEMPNGTENLYFDIIDDGLDVRDLDIDYVMRISLLEGAGAEDSACAGAASSSSSSNCQGARQISLLVCYRTRITTAITITILHVITSEERLGWT